MKTHHQIITHPQSNGWTRIDWRPNTETYIRFQINHDHKTFKIVDLWMTNPTIEAIRSLPLTRIETALNAGAIGASTPRTILRRPKKRYLDDNFYISVAITYRDALARGLNPRPTMSADTGAADATVAGWIGESRRRGHLPPTTPGKRNA